MDVLYLTMFVSLVLGGLGVFLFAWSAKRGDADHADRLAILPLADTESSGPGELETTRTALVGANSRSPVTRER